MILPKLDVDIDALLQELHDLAAISDCDQPPPAVTRVVYTPTDLRARDFLRERYEAAGLTVRIDAIGNTFARWEGSDPEAPCVGTGSHTDAIPHSGMYDGAVGVLGGLEAIRALQRSGYQPRRSIELIMFSSEEPTRFGVGCTGSRLMSGAMTPEELAHLTDDGDQSLDDVRQQAGFEGNLADAVLASDYFDAFVELHIEQGPRLEQAGIPIGIVTAIAAPATFRFQVDGEGGHAGGVLMPDRHDALAAAAEMIYRIERLAMNSESPDLVATVGRLDVHPGAVNSIPSRVTFSLDLRDIDLENREAIWSAIDDEAKRVAERRKLQIESQIINADPPAAADPRIIAAVGESAAAMGHASQEMISRAYHDSLFMARIAPTGMIFIPCRDGVSHRPDEYAAPKDIEAGVAVLGATLAHLANRKMAN